MALVLPRRLAPVLPTTYSPRYLLLAKAHAMHEHSGSLYHACAHCKKFLTAAPRRARTSISVSFLGRPLSRPLRIVGLVVLYTTNNLIRRQLILRRRSISEKPHSSMFLLPGIILSFPRLSRSVRQIIDVLLSGSPWYCYHRLACLRGIPIAAISCRINR